MRETVTVSFATSAIVLDLPSTARGAIDFLRAYLEPYHRIGPAPAVRPVLADVYIDISTDVSPGRTFDGATSIVVDRSNTFMHCTAAVRDDGGERWIRFDPSGVTMAIDRRTRAVRVHARTAEALRVPLVRLIEDLTIHHLERAGGVFIHAAAVATPAGAVVIAGTKGAGKSSILCHSLRHFDVAALANDNCILSLEAGRPYVRGWSGFFNVSVGTLAVYDELSGAVPPELQPLLDRPDDWWRTPQKLSLFAAEAAECFRAPIDPAGPLSALVIARFDPASPAGVRLVAPDDVTADVDALIQGSQHPNRTENWLGLEAVPRSQLRQNLLGLLNAAKDTMRVYQLSWTTPLESLLTVIPPLGRQRRRRRNDVPRGGQRAWPPLPAHAR